VSQSFAGRVSVIAAVGEDDNNDLLRAKEGFADPAVVCETVS
jgi:hypothetical protein